MPAPAAPTIVATEGRSGIRASAALADRTADRECPDLPVFGPISRPMIGRGRSVSSMAV
jgi:hypothetical protein